MAFSDPATIGLILTILGVIWLGGGFVKTQLFEIHLQRDSLVGTIFAVWLIGIGLFIVLCKTLLLQ
ncbi:hypothetical protein Q5688_25870 [Microcoleus sp. herbarium5]